MESENITSETISNENLIKILVATDIHLGYNEKDLVRGDDSFIAFEEILQLAVSNDVDFILLGGDLFHDATPSPNSLNKCLKLLRTYTLGDKPIQIEFLSDQSVNFGESLNKTVNYEDPNLNVAYPVFSIHGNHDDPSGFGRYSSLDILSITGLINYFGKWTDLTKVEINPLLIKKGETQLAIYGLSHIRDVRLARLFLDSKIEMMQPSPETGDWFNVMVLHQNRADRGPKNYLPEEMLPQFMDLVIWGHEHDCRIWPEQNPKKEFWVTQPGSSVATSLAQGESMDKHVGLLCIHKGVFKLEPIKLKTVRPFIFDSINLANHADELGLAECDAVDRIHEFIAKRIEEMIEMSKEKLSGHPNQPTLPLIRLNVHYSDDYHFFNDIRFGQKYNSKVANPLDMVKLQKSVRRIKNEEKQLDANIMDDAFNQQVLDKPKDIKVDDVVNRYFLEVEDGKKLKICTTSCLWEFTLQAADYEDDDACNRIVNFYQNETLMNLKNKLPAEDIIDEELATLQLNDNVTFQSMLKMLDERNSKQPTTTIDKDTVVIDDDDSEDDDDDDKGSTVSSVRSSPRARSNVRSSPRAKATGKKRDNDFVFDDSSAARKQPARPARGRGFCSRGSRTTAAKTTLNVTKTTRASKNQPLMSDYAQRSPSTRNRSKVQYVDSSDSDS